MEETVIRIRDLSALLLFAMRYSADRRTGAALMVANIMKQHWASIDEQTQLQIAHEVEDEHSWSHEDWREFLSWMRDN